MSPLLAIYMNERGRDSWGVAGANQDGVICVEHRLGSILDSFQEFNLNGPIYHCRAASVGDVKLENCHPFVCHADERSVVGLHNGHIRNHLDLRKKYERFKHAVDSNHIFSHIAEGKSVADLEGWGAIAWYEWAKDKPTEPSLHLARFNSEFLHIAKLRTGELVFASTKRSIEIAIQMCSAELQYFYKIEPNINYQVVNGVLHRHGAMPFGKDPVHIPISQSFRPNQGSSNVQNFRTEYSTRNGRTVKTIAFGYCAMKGCFEKVNSDQVVCDKCMEKLESEYLGENDLGRAAYSRWQAGS